MNETSFMSPDEKETIDVFLKQGYIIFPLQKNHLLNDIKKQVYDTAIVVENDYQDILVPKFFDQFHLHCVIDNLNGFRVKLISELSKNSSLRPTLYALGKKYIDWLVGNELVMQRTCNFSIQLPGDKSSLLPLHADVWSGNSPYEIVFWLPLVDCYGTKSMFLLPLQESKEISRKFSTYLGLSTEELFNKVSDRLVWLDVPFGHGVLFWHGLLHGNRVNEENETRWSINVRFKSLLSPFGTKELGESFLPITIRPCTRMGYDYKEPRLDD